MFKDFQGVRAMVIGDVMVDAYLYGHVDRISPEAPVPIVSLTRRVNMLGGAANVALNIKALGATPLLFSVTGNDLKSHELLDLLAKDKLSAEGIIKSPARITTTKFRIIGNKTQILRVDEEILNNLTTEEETLFLQKIHQTIQNQQIHVIVFQDYNKGVITKNVIENVIVMARDKGIPVAVDPKKKNFETYHGAKLFKPNLKELREGLKADFSLTDKNALYDNISLLQQRNQHEMVMVTLGDEGIVIRFKKDGEHQIHSRAAHIRKISDVSGAGDTVISVAALCVALDAEPRLMAFLANLAGGIVCEYVGVVPIEKNRLQREALTLINHKGQE